MISHQNLSLSMEFRDFGFTWIFFVGTWYIHLLYKVSINNKYKKMVELVNV